MKKNTTRKIFLILFLIIFFVIAIISFIYLKKTHNFFDNPKYIATSKRKDYIIANVDDTLLKKYVSKKDNTLIIFWASWCSTCIEESEQLNNFMINNPNIPIIIVSHDKNISDLQNYLSINNYNWFVILDTEKSIRESIDNGSKGIPATYLLDNNLNILSKTTDTMTEEEFFNFYNLIK